MSHNYNTTHFSMRHDDCIASMHMYVYMLYVVVHQQKDTYLVINLFISLREVNKKPFGFSFGGRAVDCRQVSYHIEAVHLLFFEEEERKHLQIDGDIVKMMVMI